MEKSVNTALKTMLPLYRTTLLTALYRESSTPQMAILLEVIRRRHSARLHSFDKKSINPRLVEAGNIRLGRTYGLTPECLRPALLALVFEDTPDPPIPIG